VLIALAALAPVPGSADSYRIIAPEVVGCSAPFWITVVALDAVGDTKTDYCGTTDFTSTDVTATIAGTPMAAYNYTWKSSVACSGVPNDDGVRVFVNVVLRLPGLQTITAADTVVPATNGLASIMVGCPDVKLTGSPRLVVADSGTTVQFRACWSNYGTDSVFSFLITDAVPTNMAFVPEASVAALDGGNTHGLPLTVGYSTVATPMPPAPDSFADGNPVSGTRWLRWTVPEVGVATTGCACFRVKVD
jgi:uncharacterized repeat protein (TIGR01451 family)